VGDAEVQHQRHRARRVRKVGRQLNISTISTPAFGNVLRLGFMRSTEKVSQLLNRPVMSLFGTRMSGTSTEMVSHRIQLKLPATTGAEKRGKKEENNSLFLFLFDSSDLKDFRG
jgi:hypothetical protein